ncbi:HIG1 domain-containing protein [Aphelenchoides besseyi]|nr:HIG1 domain-containing protein [Aphelenchoides besseyi]
MLKAPILLRAFRPTSIKCYSSNATSSGTEKQPKEIRERPLYATRQNFEKQKLVERYGRSATEDSGVKVTKFQRRMLVLTGLYKHSKNIPEYVPYATMNRLHDRSRVVFIVVGCLVSSKILLIVLYQNSGLFLQSFLRLSWEHRVPFTVIVSVNVHPTEMDDFLTDCTSNTNMSSLRLFLLKAAGLRVAYADEHKKSNEHEVETDKHSEFHKQNVRYSGIPAFPSDIGYHGGKDVSGKKQSGVASNVLGNPFVVIGMGLTTIALLGMLRKSFLGDKAGAQKYMRYRIMAQFFTVTALVAGVTFFGATYDKTNKDAA